jgi:peptidoglycan/xylan/chitin deacetylase (PgdA/CDA1 family)
LKTHGDPSWEARPSYLSTAVPIALDAFEDAGVKITFFVVGDDAEREPHQHLLADMAQRGHEIGNHSFSHEPWFHLYSDDRIEEEIDRTDRAIEVATGTRPTSFRGPGYSVSEPLLRQLSARGYVVDASTLPTWIGPMARAYYFRSTKLTEAQRRERRNLFGSWGDGRRPVSPYKWDLPEGDLLELPVTTFPFVRVPMHVSYVLYLERVSPKLARTYFRTALRACRMARVSPSILLHPLDLLGGDDLPGSGLEFFPGMSLPGAQKRALVRDCIALLREQFDVVTIGEHSRRALEHNRLPVVAPSFDASKS